METARHSPAAAATEASIPSPLSLRIRGRSVFYGWAVVAAAFAADFLTYGISTVAFTLFFTPMSASLGWSRGLLSSAIVVSRAVDALTTPFLGPVVDRRGPRAVMAAGALALGGGTMALGLVEAPGHFYLVYGVVMALGLTGLGSTISHTVVSKWFVRHRGRALSAVTMGYSLAGILLPLPVTFLIVSYGWRTAWMVLGVVTLVLGLAAAWMMRRQPEDFGLLPDGAPHTDWPGPDTFSSSMSPVAVVERRITARQAVRTPSFWLLIAGSNLGVMALFGINIHLVPYLLDQGLEAAVAAGVYTALYSMQFLAKPLWGFIAERLHVRFCAAICYFGGGLGLALLLAWPTLVGIGLFVVVYGLTRGAQSLVMSIAWADYFGRESLGAIRGISAPFGMVAGAAGPILGGWLFDVLGSYHLAFGIFVAGFWLGSALVLMAQPPESAEASP